MSEYIKRSVWTATALLGCFGLALSAEGASFDCGKAQTKVEHLICDDADLSKLDDVLAQSYKAARQDSTKGDPIKQAQRLWIRKRNICGDKQCLKESYFSRQAELDGNTPVKLDVPNTKLSDELCLEVGGKLHTLITQPSRAGDRSFGKYEIDSYVLHAEINGADESYSGIDIDKDGIAEQVTLSCAASNVPADPCYLDVLLSSGGGFSLEAWNMFLISYKTHILILANQTIQSSKDFDALREMHIWQLFLTDKSGVTRLCRNL